MHNIIKKINNWDGKRKGKKFDTTRPRPYHNSMSTRTAKKQDKIIIDEAKGLVFDNEEGLYQHFFKEISTLEQEFFSLRPKDDIDEKDFDKYERNLALLLDAPDEIWFDKDWMRGKQFHVYIKKFASEDNENPLYHVAVVYLTDRVPSFVYLHFPTTSENFMAKYKRGEKIFDRSEENIPVGAIEGDALSEGDDFARGLYQAMMKVRSEADIKEDQFLRYAALREETIEHPDEIWRSNDSMGNVLVSFIRDFPEEAGTIESAIADEDSGDSEDVEQVTGGKGLHYIVVTIEDMPSNSHALLFSFPTTDEQLVGRYRHGENLQAEEVVQEASH